LGDEKVRYGVMVMRDGKKRKARNEKNVIDMYIH
jgi:hypothetical protein